MKRLVPFFMLIGAVGCSQSNDHSATRPTVNAPIHRYLVTFAAVKIPNTLLKPDATHTNGINLGAIKDRYEFASYLLAHTNEYSFTTTAGNGRPKVSNGRQTSIRFQLNSAKEQADLDRTGMQLQRLESDIEVKNEDGSGSLRYEGQCGYFVHLKEPIGGSSDQGGTIPFPGGMLPVGQPDLVVLYQTGAFTLCGLVALNRAD